MLNKAVSKKLVSVLEPMKHKNPRASEDWGSR